MNNNRPRPRPQQQQQSHQNMQQIIPGSSLTRYRSAPSSYFATLLSSPTNDAVLGGDDLDHLFNPRAATSPEAPGLFSRFTPGGIEAARRNSPNGNAPPQSQLLPPPGKVEAEQLQRPQISDYSSSYGGFTGSYNSGQVKTERVGGGGAPSLIRHSSSPAGLFANPDFENEIGTMRAMGNFGGGNAEASCSSASRFKIQMNPIPEIDIKVSAGNNDDDYIPGISMNSWDDSEVLSDNFFKGLDEQSKEGGSRPPARLSHHLSLPTSSSELSTMEKLFQDSVPCKIRAKRGFATHPRSIAERVRRTKISERIRKLQELVPNMDKQTNTSDMLDFAVDYIKVLQSQVETLSDNRAKCSCSAKQHS